MSLLYRVVNSLLFLVVFIVKTQAQSSKIDENDWILLQKQEQDLVILADSLRFATLPDERKDYSLRFVKRLRETLAIPHSFEYPFEQLSQSIHILYPQDKSFRLFNWLLITSDVSKFYYGAIQQPGEELRLTPLLDYSDRFEDYSFLSSVLEPKQWYGCEYYRIMQDQNIAGNNYILFGFNTKKVNSNEKLIDVLTFDSVGNVKFGAPIFYLPDDKKRQMALQHRMVLEFKKGVPVNLNYDSERKMIMFSHLVSEIEDPRRKATYIPSGRTDGLKKENGQWIFVPEAIPILQLEDGQAPIDGVMR